MTDDRVKMYFKRSTLIATLCDENYPLGMAEDLKKELYEMVQAYANEQKRDLLIELEVNMYQDQFDIIRVWDAMEELKKEM